MWNTAPTTTSQQAEHSHVLWGEPELSGSETDASEDEAPTAPKKSDFKTPRSVNLNGVLVLNDSLMPEDALAPAKVSCVSSNSSGLPMKLFAHPTPHGGSAANSEEMSASDSDSDGGKREVPTFASEMSTEACTSDMSTDVDWQEQQQQFLQSLRAQLPLDEEGLSLSLGSLRHVTGNCKACIFHAKGSCSNGIACTFCHCKHSEEDKEENCSKLRPCKGKRRRYKKLIARLQERIETDPFNFELESEKLPSFVATNSTVKAKVLSNINQTVRRVKAEKAKAAYPLRNEGH